MSTFAPTPSETTDEILTPDDFSILEHRVLRAVELLRNEREARAVADANASTLQQLLDEQSVQLSQTEARLKTLETEREQVRTRVERMMKQLDEIG